MVRLVGTFKDHFMIIVANWQPVGNIIISTLLGFVMGKNKQT